MCSSDLTAINLYPFTAHTMARPVPVFPLVSSTIGCPLFKLPFFSASSIICNATLSFLLNPGFRYSSLAYILPSTPYAFTSRLKLTIGVCPIALCTPESSFFNQFPSLPHYFELYQYYRHPQVCSWLSTLSHSCYDVNKKMGSVPIYSLLYARCICFDIIYSYAFIIILKYSHLYYQKTILCCIEKNGMCPYFLNHPYLVPRCYIQLNCPSLFFC